LQTSNKLGAPNVQGPTSNTNQPANANNLHNANSLRKIPEPNYSSMQDTKPHLHKIQNSPAIAASTVQNCKKLQKIA